MNTEENELADEFKALKDNEAFRVTNAARAMVCEALRAYSQDKETLAELLLTSPRTGKPLKISSELEKQTDNSLRFTVTGEDGERWGIVFGLTELKPNK